MKLVDLRSILNVYAKGLARVGAVDSAAALRHFNDLCLVLKSKKAAELAALMRTFSDRSLAVANSGPTVRDLVSAFAALAALAPALSTKKKEEDLTSDLANLCAALIGFEQIGAESYTKALLSHVVSVSRRANKGGPATVNEPLVIDYSEKLERALPDAAAFLKLFSELTADERVQQAEAVALATRFMGPTSARTSRPKALAKIKERHSSLMRARASARAQAGKSAA